MAKTLDRPALRAALRCLSRLGDVTVAENKFLGFELLLRACSQGDAKGCEHAKAPMKKEQTANQEKTKATAERLQKDCESGDGKACEQLADTLSWKQGGGIARDYTRALSYYQRACDRGQLESCFLVAYMSASA